jgi:AcrR family transcriptional regulator
MTKPTAQTKSRILEAALECLKEEGFAGATWRAHAARRGFKQTQGL